MPRRLAGFVAALSIALVSCSPNPTKPLSPRPLASPSETQVVPTPSEMRLRFAAVGDIGDGSANEAAVAAAIARSHSSRRFDLLLLVGDLIYPEGDPAQYEEKFAKPYAPVTDLGIEIRAVLGNHDVLTDPDGMISAFKMPSRYYSIEEGPAHFFALDSSPGVVDASQATWLDAELSRSEARWKVVLLHHPIYSSGLHGSTVPIRDALESMLVRHGVQLVLSGHDHNYERTIPLNGIVHIVSGAGCCPRAGPVKANSFTASFQVGLGFVVGEVRSDVIEISRVAVEGNVTDSFTIPYEAQEKAAPVDVKEVCRLA